MKLFLVLEAIEDHALEPGDIDVRVRKSGEIGYVSIVVPAAQVQALGRTEAIAHAASRALGSLVRSELDAESGDPL